MSTGAGTRSWRDEWGKAVITFIITAIGAGILWFLAIAPRLTCIDNINTDLKSFRSDFKTDLKDTTDKADSKLNGLGKDLVDIKGAIKVLYEKSGNLSKDVDAIRDSVSRRFLTSADQRPVGSWLLAVAPIKQSDGTSIIPVRMLDTQSGQVTSWLMLDNGKNENFLMGRLWGAAKAADLEAQPLNALQNKIDPNDPATKLWLGFSFAISTSVANIAPNVLLVSLAL